MEESMRKMKVWAVENRKEALVKLFWVLWEGVSFVLVEERHGELDDHFLQER